MILSNIGIQNALKSGALVITPKPEPLRPDGKSECPYQTTSVDLKLGNEVSWIKDDLPVSLDLREGKLAKLLTSSSEKRELTESAPYVLQPNKFVLAKTLETVELPIRESGQCLAARVEGKSSYARCGLLVHFTAPTIHTGFKGTITLEMMNFGKYSILLYPGIPICQLIIETVDETPFRNDSQFQGQNTAAGLVQRNATQDRSES